MYSIRTAAFSDIPLIRELAYQTWPAAYNNILEQQQMNYMLEAMYSEESLTRQMTEEQQTFFIAETDGIPSGYLSVEPKSESEFIIQKVYVSPQSQGKGIGRLLVEHVIVYLKDRHAQPFEISLFVNRNNKAVEFYKHIGFEIVSERDFHIGNGYYMNDYIMRLVV